MSSHSNILQNSSFFVSVIAIALLLLVNNRSQSQQLGSRLTGSNSRNVHAIKLEGWLTQTGCPVFALETIDVPVQDEGELQEVLVKQNDQVKAHQTIARQDPSLAEKEVQLARGQERIAIKEANGNQEVLLAQKVAEDASIGLERFRSIQERGSVTEFDVRQREIALDQANYRVEVAKVALEQRKNRAEIAKLTTQVADVKLGRLSIKSPIDGEVIEVTRKSGEWVQSGQTICKISNLNELRVDFFANIHDADPARLKDRSVLATARFAGNEQAEFVGKVTGYDPEVSASGLVRVHATIRNDRKPSSARLLPGMEVDLKVQLP